MQIRITWMFDRLPTFLMFGCMSFGHTILETLVVALCSFQLLVFLMHQFIFIYVVPKLIPQHEKIAIHGHQKLKTFTIIITHIMHCIILIFCHYIVVFGHAIVIFNFFGPWHPPNCIPYNTSHHTIESLQSYLANKISNTYKLVKSLCT